MSANVTSFNSGALEWVTSSKAKVVCLQETHLTPEMLHGRRATLQALGWDLYAEPASLSDKGTRLGGTACAFPKNSGVWQKATYQCKGAGYTAVGLRQRRWDYTIVSLYLRDTEGLNGPTNAEVLSSLVAFVRTLPEPWIILGDWNLDPTEVQDTALIQVMRGRMVATGGYMQPWGGAGFWGCESEPGSPDGSVCDLGSPVETTCSLAPQSPGRCQRMEVLEASPVPEAHGRPQKPRMARGNPPTSP